MNKLSVFGVCPPHSRGVACVNGQVYIECILLFGTSSCEVPTIVRSLLEEASLCLVPCAFEMWIRLTTGVNTTFWTRWSPTRVIFQTEGSRLLIGLSEMERPTHQKVVNPFRGEEWDGISAKISEIYRRCLSHSIISLIIAPLDVDYCTFTFNYLSLSGCVSLIR